MSVVVFAGAACLNGATCHDRVGSFYCQCPPGNNKFIKKILKLLFTLRDIWHFQAKQGCYATSMTLVHQTLVM